MSQRQQWQQEANLRFPESRYRVRCQVLGAVQPSRAQHGRTGYDQDTFSLVGYAYPGTGGVSARVEDSSGPPVCRDPPREALSNF